MIVRHEIEGEIYGENLLKTTAMLPPAGSTRSWAASAAIQRWQGERPAVDRSWAEAADKNNEEAGKFAVFKKGESDALLCVVAIRRALQRNGLVLGA